MTDADIDRAIRTGLREAAAKDAATDASCVRCGRSFAPVKRWQRFCGRACRQAFHEAEDGGLRAVVSSVRVMKRGTVSVTLHFDPLDRDAALGIDPGAVVEISK